MNIFSIGNFGTSWDGSICDEEHIARALEDFGHEVKRRQRDNPFWPAGFKPDFVLIAQWDQYASDMIVELKQWYDCPVVYWAFDYQADGQAWHEQLIKQSDLYLSKRIADSKYPNWQWLSQDFAPQFLDEAPEVEKDIDVLFTGSYLPWATERNATLKAVDKKFNLEIHSVNVWPGFKNQQGPVMDDALPALIARAKINLSIDHTIERGYWSDRNSQIICCGGFVLCRYVPMMESTFQHDIMYFHNIEDCLNQIEFWLDHDEDREVVSGLAYDHSFRYTVKERVADMLEIVEEIL